MGKNKFSIILAMSILVLILVACGITINTGTKQDANSIGTFVARTVAAQTEEKVAHPPTVTTTPTPNLPQNTQTPSPTPIPCNKPKFLRETIRDHTFFDPGTDFIKTWTIRNDGSCTWDRSYRFIFIDGYRMGGVTSLILPKVVVPGDIVTISLSLKAPSAIGVYTGVWRFQSGTGEIFGNYWARINAGIPAGPFAVTSVRMYADNVNITGTCPQTFHIGADITANAPGYVTYRFQFSDGSYSPAVALTYTAAGLKPVAVTWSINATGDYWAKIYIDAPNHQLFWPVNLHLTCI
jgi:hypothetical protein